MEGPYKVSPENSQSVPVKGQLTLDPSEVQVIVPKGDDPYATAQLIRELVEQETEEAAKLAEQDWERITREYGTQSFSARPAVDLRPVSSGLEVQVRYITRGPQRHEVKSRLFAKIVDVLQASKPA